MAACCSTSDVMHVTLRLGFALLAVSCLCWAPTADAAASVQAALGQFQPSADILEQRQALLDILDAVGNPLELLQTSPGLASLGYAGNSSWGMEGISYCWWWGVTCCGSTLAMELSVCSHFQGVSSLEVPALGLTGTLPDVFDKLPDLQVLMVGYNRGEQSNSNSSSNSNNLNYSATSRRSSGGNRQRALACSSAEHSTAQHSAHGPFTAKRVLILHSSVQHDVVPALHASFAQICSAQTSAAVAVSCVSPAVPSLSFPAPCCRLCGSSPKQHYAPLVLNSVYVCMRTQRPCQQLLHHAHLCVSRT